MTLLDMRAQGAGGGAPIDATFITQTPSGTLTNEQALSLLATGLVKNTTGTGVLSIATQGTDYSLLPVADTQTIVKGSADETKLLRFEVDGFTTGTTRVLTPPNANITIAGQNFANSFSAVQAIDITLNTTSTSNALSGEIANSNTGSLRGLSYAARSLLAAGTMAFLMGIRGSARNTAAGTVTNSYAFYADTTVNTGGGFIGTVHGLYVADQNVGSTANYAIYTNAGLNRFGDSAEILQTSATAARPTLKLQQADLSEEFIRFQATVGAGNPIDTAALGAYYGKVRVYVEGVGAKWLALYD